MRILWVSNAPWVGSGYGTQTRSILHVLQELGHEVACAAFYGLQGAITTADGIKTYPIAYNDLGVAQLPGYAREFKADLVITLYDIWPLPKDFARQLRVPWAPYFPVDHQPVPEVVADRARASQFPIVYSEFGRREMERAGVSVRYVPHMVDADLFAPGDRAAARARLHFPDGERVYIAGMVAANRGVPSRKAFAENMEAFSRFCQARPDLDAYLYLHADYTTMDSGVDIHTLAENLGIEKRVIYPQLDGLRAGLPTRYLAGVYQALDVLLAAAQAEGFGLPIVEAQACGCPVITTDFTSMPELTFNGIAVPPVQRCWTTLSAWWAVPSVEGITEALLKIAARPPAKQEAEAERGRQAMVDRYSIPAVRECWRQVLAEIEAELRGPVKWAGLAFEDDPRGGVVGTVAAEIATHTYPLDYLNLLPDDAVIDVGAHVGVVSIYLAKRFPGVRVFAYEPVPASYERLRRNLEANATNGAVTAFRLAVAAPGVRRVRLTGDLSRNSGSMTTVLGDGPDVAEAEAVSLPEVLAEHRLDRVKLLKVDCEGSEYDILTPDVLARVDNLVGEFHGPGGADLLDRCKRHVRGLVAVSLHPDVGGRNG